MFSLSEICLTLYFKLSFKHKLVDIIQNYTTITYKMFRSVSTYPNLGFTFNVNFSLPHNQFISVLLSAKKVACQLCIHSPWPLPDIQSKSSLQRRTSRAVLTDLQKPQSHMSHCVWDKTCLHSDGSLRVTPWLPIHH